MALIHIVLTELSEDFKFVNMHLHIYNLLNN